MHDADVLKGVKKLYDENQKEVSIDEIRKALSQCYPFIKSMTDWRAGRFTITITEWQKMPALIKDLITLHDNIISEMK